MTSYKLTYFNIRGRGEVVRILFKLAGVDFEDQRIEFPDEWMEYKAKTPFGRLPILEVDGKQLTESKAIMRYLAREFGFYGDTNWGRSQVDCVLDMLEDFHVDANKMFYAQAEERDRIVAEAKVRSLEILANLEKKLKENNNGDGFFVGNKITIADVLFFCETFFVPALTGDKEIIKGFPKLLALRDRVGQNQRIAAWVAQRPQTAF
ncbi:S-crystallin SL11-like [Amphiura filiformis]|uniref:S-crystallin SL11-like n=1 Tax=Amphiura filiformis TaxID=82378 RepID=UPI003B21577E